MHTNDEDDASRITAPWRAVVLLLSQALLCASGGRHVNESGKISAEQLLGTNLTLFCTNSDRELKSFSVPRLLWTDATRTVCVTVVWCNLLVGHPRH